jgi:hypothetical protein
LTLAWKEGNVSSFRQVGPAFLAAALIAGIAGCATSGGSGSGSAAASATPSTGATTSADPLARLSAAEVAKEAVADTEAAASVHLAGTVKESGQTITLSETLAHSGTECSGKFSLSGQGTVQIILLGATIWMKPDDTFWRSGGIKAAALPRVSGKWLRTSASAADATPLAAMCSISTLIGDQVPPSDPNLFKDPITEPDGKVLSLELMDGPSGASFYVTDGARPLITRFDSLNYGADGSVDLTGYGAAATITAPPASEVINPSVLAT